MMDATVVWKKGLSFTGTALTTGFSLPLGADPKVGGENDGFRPTELLLVGLAGCTAMDVISILAKKRVEVSAFEVKSHGERAEKEPRPFTSFRVEYIVKGKKIDRAVVERAVELSETKYCSVMATLRSAGPVERSITVIDE
jgi:putative redox protein